MICGCRLSSGVMWWIILVVIGVEVVFVVWFLLFVVELEGLFSDSISIYFGLLVGKVEVKVDIILLL